MSLSCVCCVLCRKRSLRRADHPSREILPGLCMCLIVCDVDTSTVKRPRRVVSCCASEVEISIITRKYVHVANM